MAVMLFHYTVRFPQLYPTPHMPAVQFTHGDFGVDLFFGISGFVIFMTLERTRRSLDFVVSRFARLWPAYLCAGLITYVAVHGMGLPGRDVTPAQALWNVTMLHDLLGAPSIDPVYWSLQVELIFYFWMFLAYRTGALRHIGVWLWVALLPTVAYLISSMLFHHELSYLLGTLLLVRYAPFFVIGIAAYRVRARGLHIADLALIACATATAAAYLAPVDGLLAVGVSLVLLALARGRLRWIASGPLVFAGTIAYTLYLVHQNIGYIVIREAERRGVDVDVAIVIALLFAIALATALTYVVERPARDWLRDKYRDMQTLTAADRAQRVPAKL